MAADWLVIKGKRLAGKRRGTELPKKALSTLLRNSRQAEENLSQSHVLV